jgi:pantoate--beta-alanine ligase
MNTLRTIAGLRDVLRPVRRACTLGLVPTMGALHRGHLALVQAARADCRHVVASVFVNPTQFNDPADLAAYPRQDAEDAALAEAAGVDTLFVPMAEEVYGDGDATWVDIGGAADRFEGAFRPGHFRGVATVVLKLLNMVQPHVAYFGQKDAQQVAVVRQLVRDLKVDVRIAVVPTVRDADGLALSSRNARLSTADRHRALAIPRALDAALSAHQSGGDVLAAARRELAEVDVEYAEVARFDGTPTLVIAARVGGTRLIDNVPLDHPELAGLAPDTRREVKA